MDKKIDTEMSMGDRIRELYEQGKEKPEIAKIIAPDFSELTYDQVYHRVKRYIHKIQSEYTVDENGNRFVREDFFSEDEGIVLKRAKITDKYHAYDIWLNSDGKLPDAKEVAEKVGVDTAEWKISEYFYEAANRNTRDGAQTFYKARLKVVPANSELTTDAIVEINKGIKYERKPLHTFAKKDSKQLLEIVFADMHMGLYASEEETGQEINFEILKDRYEGCLSDIKNYAKKNDFKAIRFVTLGDVIHVDNSKQTTTSGTFQQIDGRLSDIIKKTENMIINSLDIMLEELRLPIEYVYIPGNHDRDTGYAVATAIETAFRKEPNITFDTSPNPFKFKQFGASYVCYHHGDCNVKNLDMGKFYSTPERREIFCKVTDCEVHLGHLHHGETNFHKSGINVRYFPSITGSSYWEHQQGYDSARGVLCSVYDEDLGRVGEYFSKI